MALRVLVVHRAWPHRPLCPLTARPAVILLTGPAGSGKSTTAARIAEHRKWVHLSEDDHWVTIKAGRTAGELRTPQEQDIVQQQMLGRVFDVLSDGRKAVLEFILYEDPPRPLLRYQAALTAERVDFVTMILRPSVDELLRRIQLRGRTNDMDRPGLRAHAEHQLRVLDSQYIEEDWVVDTTDLTLERAYEQYFKPIAEP